MFELETTTFESLRALRKDYLRSLTAPLDGMWEDAFFAKGRHWRIHLGGDTLGYCACNADNELLGFQCLDASRAADAFQYCLQTLNIVRGYASTVESSYLSLCLDHQTAVRVNALMYRDARQRVEGGTFPADFRFRRLMLQDYKAAIAFGLRAIGDEQAWLESYYAERIEREELFGVWSDDALCGAGELRLSPMQYGVADVGMAVLPEFRGQGLAIQILKQLAFEGVRRDLRVICSTAFTNTAARGAIRAAGFDPYHRILEFHFG